MGKCNILLRALVVVRSHRTPDKRARIIKAIGHPFEYEFGRIQITVPKELVGIEAKVHIEFPNAPEVKEKTRRSRYRFDYYQLQDGGHFGKK
jgi:hypothetical protein